MEKRKVILVGGGVIATHYREGLAASHTLRPVALADVDPSCAARACFDVPFFTDAEEAVAATGADLAILAVPPAARFSLAARLFALGADVLAEKPIAPSLAAVDALYGAAHAHGRALRCMYHWKAADEVLFLREHVAALGALREIDVCVRDDYAASGKIRADRLGLGGAWIDSGINVLSYIDELIDLRGICPTAFEEQRDESGMRKYVCKSFVAGDVHIRITVDWRTASRAKTSRICGSKGVWEVDHTAQKIFCGGETVYDCPVPDRLGAHYRNLFAHLTADDDYMRTRRLHEILFDGEEKA